MVAVRARLVSWVVLGESAAKLCDLNACLVGRSRVIDHEVGEIALGFERVLRGLALVKCLFTPIPRPRARQPLLARRIDIRLLRIAGPKAEALIAKDSFFAQGRISKDTYKGVPATTTLTVGAQFVVSAKVDEALVYGITRALWHDSSRALLNAGHPKGHEIRLETALEGIAIPLHPGAERFYREAGMIE